MTPQEQTAFRAAVRANPACADAYAVKDCHAIQAIMSVGRTKGNDVRIGNGTVLDVMGLTDGTAFLNILQADTRFKFVQPLLEQGRLEIGRASVQDQLQQMATAGALTHAYADALCALGHSPAPYDYLEVHEALYEPDGTEIP